MLIPQESKVGKKLSDLTTRRVIILVLAMLISVPIFSPGTYMDDNNSYVVAMYMMMGFPTGDEGFNLVFKSYIEE
jgi:hypothetical protein